MTQLFNSVALRHKEKQQNIGEMFYILNMVPADNQEKLQKATNEYLKSMNMFRDCDKNFICRVYLLNVSNITLHDGLDKDFGFYWIKRYNKDENFKQDKKFFDLEEGEINDAVSMPVKWPVWFFNILNLNKLFKDFYNDLFIECFLNFISFRIL